MTDLEKYETVNSCESFAELLIILKSFANKMGIVEGRTKGFSADKMILACKYWWDSPHLIEPNCMTRMWGLRQQMMYLRYYNLK